MSENPLPEPNQLMRIRTARSLEAGLKKRTLRTQEVGRNLFASISRRMEIMEGNQDSINGVNLYRTSDGERTHVDARFDLTQQEWGEFNSEDSLYKLYQLISGEPEEWGEGHVVQNPRFTVEAIGMHAQVTDLGNDASRFGLKFRFIVAEEPRFLVLSFDSQSGSIQLQPRNHQDPRMQEIQHVLRQIKPDEAGAPSEDVLELIEDAAQVFHDILDARIPVGKNGRV